MDAEQREQTQDERPEATAELDEAELEQAAGGQTTQGNTRIEYDPAVARR